MDGPTGFFLGVPEEELRAIGCVTVVAARLEWTIRAVSADLHRSPGKLQATGVLRQIRLAMQDGLPVHARVDAETIENWTVHAQTTLAERNVVTHSAAVRHGAHPVMVHLRSGDIEPMQAGALMEVADQIAAAEQEGFRVLLGLRRTPRPGIYLPNTVVDGSWVPLRLANEGGLDTLPPTEEELRRWRRELGPLPALNS